MADGTVTLIISATKALSTLYLCANGWLANGANIYNVIKPCTEMKNESRISSSFQFKNQNQART
jgi:hypothetical protein